MWPSSRKRNGLLRLYTLAVSSLSLSLALGLSPYGRHVALVVPDARLSGDRLVRFGSCRPRYAIPVSVELCLHPIDQKTFDLPAKVLAVLGAFSLVRVIINRRAKSLTGSEALLTTRHWALRSSKHNACTMT